MPGRGSPRDAEEESLARVSGLVEFGLELRDENERLRAEVDALRGRILELEALVERDALAPVYNRRGLYRELEKALANCRRYGERGAVFYIDLDGFKRINDAHGHGTGDEVLRRVGEALLRATRLSDSVARIGGDEFVLILRHIDTVQARGKADALRALLAGLRIEHNDVVVTTEASIGLASLMPDDTPESALARADADMYASKPNR